MDTKDITEDHTHWLMDRAYAYAEKELYGEYKCACLLYTSPSPRD